MGICTVQTIVSWLTNQSNLSVSRGEQIDSSPLRVSVPEGPPHMVKSIGCDTASLKSHERVLSDAAEVRVEA